MWGPGSGARFQDETPATSKSATASTPEQPTARMTNDPEQEPMDYHKDQFAFTDRMEYLRAHLVVQGAHQWLVRYCARRETGGTIAGAADWKDREWYVATNGQLRRRDVQSVVDAGLAAWVKPDGAAVADLVVHGYDATGERECQRERKRAKDFREKRRAVNASAPTEIMDLNADATAERTPARTPTDTGARTASRTGTVRQRESDQSSPVQTSPAQPSPSTPQPPDAGGDGVGGDRVASGFDARLTALLDELGVASGPNANRKWIAQAQRNVHASTPEALLAVIRYAVRRAREVKGANAPDGKPTVNYASDVREFVTGWTPRMPAAVPA